VSPPRPAVIAHRGASGEAPENTPAAFRRALEIGVDGVELDTHLSADGEPVVIHDPYLERTTTGTGLVKDLAAAAIRRLDAGRWFGDSFAGQAVPTLAEALDLLRTVRVVVEIKNGPIYYPGIAERVTAVIRASGHDRVTVSSFDHYVLRDVRDITGEVETAVLYSARPIDPVRIAYDAGASVLHPQWVFLQQELVDDAHAAGMRVEVWTVDDAAHLAHVIAMRPDGIMTNFPARLRMVLDARPI
jgi:glycerophosphoryl diester phosphodiesterase